MRLRFPTLWDFLLRIIYSNVMITCLFFLRMMFLNDIIWFLDFTLYGIIYKLSDFFMGLMIFFFVMDVVR